MNRTLEMYTEFQTVKKNIDTGYYVFMRNLFRF